MRDISFVIILLSFGKMFLKDVPVICEKNNIYNKFLTISLTLILKHTNNTEHDIFYIYINLL